MKTYQRLAELESMLGQTIGTSDWISVSQARIQQFADATDDHQWIHLDVERAKTGPFKTTVAHGFLTLSLLPAMMYSAYEVADVTTAMNYGLNKVRFPSPVPAGSRVRGHLKLTGLESIPGGAQVLVELVVEMEGAAKPVCVAESVSRLYTHTHVAA
jgi:acyl dehydratase